DEQGLTDYDSFKKHVAESIPKSDKTIILRTSGYGKTRLCIETLCHNFGLYLIAFSYSIGSLDLEESACWMKDNIADKSAKVAEGIAVQTMITIICITGSSLSLLRARGEIFSRGKEEPHILTFNDFGRIETSDELFELVKSIIPLKEEEKEYLISSNDFNPEEQLMSLIENLTTKAEGLSNREYNIYTGFENLKKYPSGRPTNINCVATLQLMKSAFVSYSMTERPIAFTSNNEIDVMNLGFVYIKSLQKKFKCVIDESLVIQTAFNNFKRNLNNVWFQLMSQTNFNASMSGLIWEKIVVNYLRKNSLK
ncbi:6713_t:CDS:2, partial [Funneliformis geosporum]